MSIPLRARLGSLLLILVPVVRCAYEKSASSLVPPSFIETAATAAVSQSAEIDSDILFYISDEDRDNRVAVNFQDAVNYAISSLDPSCEDEDEFVIEKTNEFMTGDLYDNDLTDVSKLTVKVAIGNYIYQVGDGDDFREAIEEIEDEDELREKPNLIVIAKDRDTQPLRWDKPRRKDKLDLDDWEVSEVDTSVSTEKDHKLPIPAQKVPSREIVYDLDEEAVFIAGERKVIEDLDNVPMFYSNDGRNGMVGDLFDNKRTDQIMLKVLQRIPETRESLTEETVTEQVEVLKVTSVDIIVDERKDVNDLDEIDAVFEPKDIEIIPERDGGDLPLITAYDRSAYMVGDLFDNEHTDADKLTIVVLVPKTTKMTWFEAEKPKEAEKPVFEEPMDTDEVENIYVTPETVDFDEGETLIAKVPVVVVDSIVSKLLHQSPSDIITGDLFNNQRTDSSRLIVNELQGDPVTWDAMRDIDDMKTVYDLQTRPTLECSSDDLDEIDIADDVSDVIASINSSPDTQSALLRSRRISGDRLEFYDLEDVPAFFSFDSEDYIAGDMFDNKRSDAFKLTIEAIVEGRGAKWGSEDYDDSANPGFLQ